MKPFRQFAKLTALTLLDLVEHLAVLGGGRSLHRLGQLGDALDRAVVASGLAGLVNQGEQASLAQEVLEAEAGKFFAGERLTAPSLKVFTQGRTLAKAAGEFDGNDHRFRHLGGFAILSHLAFDHLFRQLESQAEFGGTLGLAIPGHFLGSEID